MGKALCLCNSTAGRYYRVPPRYLGFCPMFPSYESDRYRWELKQNPFAREVLGFPLRVSVHSKAERSNSNTIACQLFSGDLPWGSQYETPFGFDVVSPELMLFSLARTHSFNHLVMAMYEACGNFAFFTPPHDLASALKKHARAFAREKGLSSVPQTQVGQCDMDALFDDGWHQVKSHDGESTNMWMRAPLTSTRKLMDFADAAEGMRGLKKFREAVSCVTGITYSPFEAQLSMLLGMPLELGGMGYRNFENNRVIALDKSAGIMSGLQHAMVDLRLLSPDGLREWMLECQGKVIHDRPAKGSQDAARVTALQSMGINVTLLSNDQISDPDKFGGLLKMLSRELGIEWSRKTAKEERAEMDLRADIFSSWADLM